MRKLNIDGIDILFDKKIGEGNFSLVYKTSNPRIVAKVTVKSNEKGYRAAQNESAVLSKLKGDNIIGFKASRSASLNNQQVMILLLENCSQGSLIDLMTTLPKFTPSENLAIMVLRDVMKALIVIHKAGYTHRDVKMENMLLSESGVFKLCDYGSVTSITWENPSQMRDEIQDDIEENTTPMYRAPEQLDLYSNFPITNKVDIFAAGVLLFIFCFQKPPFESGLAALNMHYFLPEKHDFSPALINLLKLMFTKDPRQRPSAEDLLQIIEAQWNLPQAYIKVNQSSQMPNIEQRFQSVDNIHSVHIEEPLGLVDRFKRYLNELSKATEAWVEQATEDNFLPPRSQDIKSLVFKAWTKREKIVKFYTALQQKVILTQCAKRRVVLKALIVMHQYIKKGPQEVLDLDIQGKTPNFQSSLKSIITSYRNFKAEPGSELYLLQVYSNFLNSKAQLCIQYRSIFEGNFSAQPLIQKLQNDVLWSPLKIELIENLIKYWEECNLVFPATRILKGEYKLLALNISLQMVDETYSLICFLVHLYYAVKVSTNFISSPIDVDKLTQTILLLEIKFEQQFNESQQYFKWIKDNPNLTSIRDLIPSLKQGIIDYLKNVAFIQNYPNNQPFQVFKYFNPKNVIEGVALPVSFRDNFRQDTKTSGLISLNEFQSNQQISPQVQIAQSNSPAPKTGKIQSTPQKQVDFQADFQADFAQFGQFEKPQNGNSNQQNLQNNPFAQNVFPNDPFEQIYQEPIPKQQHYDFFADFQHMQGSSNSDIGSNIMDFQISKIDRGSNNINHFMKDIIFDSRQESSIIQGQNQPLSGVPKKEQINYAQTHQPQAIQFKSTPNKVEEVDLMNFNESKVVKANTDLVRFDEETPTPQSDIIFPEQKQDVDLISLDPEPNLNLMELRFDLPMDYKQEAHQKLREFLGGQEVPVEFIVPFQELQFIQQVGSGSTCLVYKGAWQAKQVAIKQLDFHQSDEVTRKEFTRELFLFLKIKKHPNLVEFYGVSIHNQNVFIITQFCDGGTVFDLLHNSINVILDWPTRMKILLDVATGMDYLHSQQIMHRDLKSLNLLIHDGYIRIADFGLSRPQADSKTFMTAVVGTFVINQNYSSIGWPQRYLKDYNTPIRQIFIRLGQKIVRAQIFIYEVCSRSIPYKEFQNQMQIMKFVTEQNGRPDLKHIEQGCPQTLIALAQRCWQNDPNQRPEFKDILREMNL